MTGLKEGDAVYYTEAPQNIISFMMGQMSSAGMGGNRSSSGGMPSGGMPGGMPSGGMPGGMGGR